MATDKFGTALRAALKDPAVAARMVELGGDIVPEAKQTPKGCAAGSSQRSDKWGALTRAAGQCAD